MYSTGKKTPGGAGTHTGHTGHTGTDGHVPVGISQRFEAGRRERRGFLFCGNYELGQTSNFAKKMNVSICFEAK